MNNLEEKKQEYTEANSYLRHYSSLRFVMFSVYFAILAGIISVAFGIVEVRTDSPVIMMKLIRIVGLLTTIAFLMYEFRLEKLIRYYQTSAKQLEGVLSYSLMKDRPPSNLTFNATRCLYFILILFWIIVIWKA